MTRSAARLCSRLSAASKRSWAAALILAGISFFIAANAPAQAIPQPRYSGTNTGTFYTQGGTIAIGTFNDTETPPCGSDPPVATYLSAQYRAWQKCLEESAAVTTFYLGLSLHTASRTSLGSPLHPGPRAGSPIFTPTLGSSVAALPFLGNQLVGVSYVPNAPTADTATAAYSVVLRRQSDCSLHEDLVLPNPLSPPNSNFFTSLTGAQDFYHQLSGLTTKADVFANGCGFQDLGLPATNEVTLLGTTPSGAIVSAELANAGLYATVTDLTANTFKNTQLTVSPSQSAGLYSSASLRSNGIMDLVETDITDPVTKVQSTAVILSNGDGTFKTPVYYDVADNAGGPGGFTIDDVTGDGIPDIVVLQTATVVNTGYPVFTGTVTTLIGKGDGTFTIGPISNLSWTSSNLTLTGDFNGDGNRDLLVGGTVLFGKGNGAFTAGPTNPAIAAANTSAIYANAVASLRNNGKLDVVVSQPGLVSLFYGNGDGTFTTGPSYASLADQLNVSITDIDGDGNPDIFLGNSSGGVYAQGVTDIYPPLFQTLMGRGDGTFVDSIAYPAGNYGAYPGNQIATADFNADSKTDALVFTNASDPTVASTLSMLPGDGKGGLGAAVTSAVNNKPLFLLAARMSHDTLPDAIVAGNGVNSAGPEVSILTNQGNGTFANEKDYTLTAAPVSLAVGDFNGDGLPDVAVGENGLGVFVRFAQSNGALGSPVQVDSSADPTGLAAASLTTDGRADLIVADQATGVLHVYLGNANNTFTSKTAPTTGATNLNVAAIGDLNSDGKPDLIVLGYIPGDSSTGTPNTANIYTFLGNGDGTFKAANTLPLLGTDGQPTSLALGDFNKDGKLDVVVGNPADFAEMLIGNGDGTFIDTIPALGQRPATIAAADLNGDGYPELLVGQTNNQATTLAVLLNQAAWTAASTALTTPTVSVAASPASITTAQSTVVTVAVSGGSGNPTPTGSVTLASGAYASASTTLASGSTAITVPAGALATGTDTLTAAYTPDSASSSIYNSATGTGSVAVTAAPVPTFVLTSGSNITVNPGATTGNTSTINVTPSGGFTGAIALKCAIAPTAANDPATCTLSPASVTITGATAATSTLTVATNAPTTAALTLPTQTGTPWYAASAPALACLLLLIMPTRRRVRLTLSLVGLSAILAVGLASCSSGSGNHGSGGNADPGTTAGTYTVTVTGTAASTTQTTTVTLTVN